MNMLCMARRVKARDGFHKRKWVATKAKPQNSNSHEVMSLQINQQPKTKQFKFPKSYCLLNKPKATKFKPHSDHQPKPSIRFIRRNHSTKKSQIKNLAFFRTISIIQIRVYDSPRSLTQSLSSLFTLF